MNKFSRLLALSNSKCIHRPQVIWDDHSMIMLLLLLFIRDDHSMITLLLLLFIRDDHSMITLLLLLFIQDDHSMIMLLLLLINHAANETHPSIFEFQVYDHSSMSIVQSGHFTMSTGHYDARQCPVRSLYNVQLGDYHWDLKITYWVNARHTANLWLPGNYYYWM